MNIDKNPFPERMLRLPVKATLKKIGNLFLQLTDPGLSDHFHHNEHPAPYVRIVQGEPTFPTLPVPDIQGRDLPPFDGDGRYMNNQGVEV